MSVRRYLGAALVTASAAIVPIGHRPPGADQGPHPCDTGGCPLGRAGYAITTLLLGQSRRTGVGASNAQRTCTVTARRAALELHPQPAVLSDAEFNGVLGQTFRRNR
jgi:hypothetical protein